MKWQWIEDDYTPRVTTLAASLIPGGDTLTVPVEAQTWIREGDIVRVESTREAMWIRSADGPIFKVMRQLGSRMQRLAAPGDMLVIISSGMSEDDAQENSDYWDHVGRT